MQVGEKNIGMLSFGGGWSAARRFEQFAIIFFAVALSLLIPFRMAFGISLSASVSSGQIVSPNIGSIAVYFDHNVAAGSVIGQNSGLIYLLDENGSRVPGTSVYGEYSGEYAPDAENPDPAGARCNLYLAVPALDPGSTYTLVVSPGITSLGGHVYGGLSETFTTSGQKPKPPEVTPPAPVDPSTDGEGGSGGLGGDSSQGTGASGEGLDEDTQGNDLHTASTDVADGDATSSQVNPSNSLASNRMPIQTPDVSSSAQGMDDASSADSTAAAGAGGGRAYVLGDLGLTPGNETVAPTTPEQTRAAATSILLLAALLVLFGAFKRRLDWQRRTHVKRA